MRRNSSGLNRPLASRSLRCEPLEHRALLTALIAAVEIAPGPASEFTQQAKSFIQSALEQVMVTQHQTPVKSSVDSLTQIAADGRPVRVTNYTVELDLPVSLLSINPAPTSIPASAVSSNGASSSRGLTSTESTISPLSNTDNRSNLVFSFMIFPDNSVSIRARLNNPLQWSGFGANPADPYGRFPFRLTPIEIGSSQQLSSSLSQPSAMMRAPSHSVTVGREFVATQESSPRNNSSIPDRNSREIQREHRANPIDDLSGNSNQVATLFDHWIEIEFSESVRAQEDKRDADCAEPSLATNSRFAYDSDLELHMVQLVGATSAIHIPPGMIQLEFQQLARTHLNAVDGSSFASAIFQVFVHASDGIRPHATAPSRDVVRWPKPPAAATTDQTEPSGWASSTWAVVALASSLVLATRPKRSDQDMAARPASGTSAY